MPHYTVLQNIAFGLELQGQEKREREQKAAESMRLVGLDGYADLMVNELSGGMQQRVGLARALANDPEVLLMDEAFSALDPLIRVQMQDELLALQSKVKRPSYLSRMTWRRLSSSATVSPSCVTGRYSKSVPPRRS